MVHKNKNKENRTSQVQHDEHQRNIIRKRKKNEIYKIKE